MFRETITRNYQSLSPSYKKIADFILSSHQRAAFMSASRLAKHLGVDVATVTRFTQHLGYEGYLQFIREVQEAVLEEMKEARAPLSERLDGAENFFALTLWQDWARLEKTIQEQDMAQADEALAALQAARRVYLVAEGVGLGLAMAASNYLQMLRDQVFVLPLGAFDQALLLKEVGPEDVVIGIGFSNYAYAATRALHVARKAGATTIGFIGQAGCPIGTEADYLFVCAAVEDDYLPAPTCLLSMIFALIRSLHMSEQDTYHRKLIRFQETYADLTEGTKRGESDVIDDLLDAF